MIDLFNIIQLFKDFNFEFNCVALEFLIFLALDANYFEFSKTCVFGLEYMSSSKLKSFFGCGGFLVVFGGLSRNPFGGGNVSSLTLFRGMGLGFTPSHFSVLGDGIGLLTLSLFDSNLINCDLLNFFRSFFFISILYDFVFKPFLGKVVILLLSFIFISIYMYYSHISLSLSKRTSLSIFRSVQMIIHLK